MTPRTVIALMAALCIIMGIARSDFSVGVGSQKKVELTFWNGWTGPDGVVALKMIREFNDKNPDLHVSMQRMPWATYYNKLMVAAVDGRGPEIFIIHASTLPRMVRAGYVANVDDLYDGPTGIPRSDFDQKVLDTTLFKGHNVGLPLDIHPQGLYCNMKLLRQAGFNHPPRDKEEFLRAVKALTKDTDGDGKPDQWGFSLSMWRNNFQSLVPQFDGQYMDKNGKVTLNSPQNVQALTFLGELAKNHLVPPPETNLGWTGFRQGKVAMVWEGVYMLGDLLRLDNLEYEGAPIPLIGNHLGTLADSHVLCIREKLSDKQREGAERFVKYLSEQSIKWAGAGQVPARLSVRALPEFSKMQVQSAFAKQIPTMLYPARTPVLFELTLEIDLAVEKVMRGRTDAKNALDIATANAQKVVDRDVRETAK